MAPQKPDMNVALKLAIWQSGKRQRQIAMEAGIPETRLSEIVNHRGPLPTAEEKDAITRVLGQSARKLFPVAVAS